MKYGELFQKPSAQGCPTVHVSGTTDAPRLAPPGHYVLTEGLRDRLAATVWPSLALDRPEAGRGILVTGPRDSGKSHLLAVLAAAAAQGGPELPGFADMTGRFVVARLKPDTSGRPLPLRLAAEIESALAAQGVAYAFPSEKNAATVLAALPELMAAVQAKHPGDGLLVVIDDLQDWLNAGARSDLLADLDFLTELSAACRGTPFRWAAAVDERSIEMVGAKSGPETARRFRESFAALDLDWSDVRIAVSAALVPKTEPQRAAIREHLTRFPGRLNGLSDRMEDFVAVFPFHPDGIEVAGKLPKHWTGGLLAFLARVLEPYADRPLDPDTPGLIGMADFWETLRADPALKTTPEIEAVARCCDTLDKWTRTEVPPEDRAVAGRIARALCLWRLIKPGIRNREGLTPLDLVNELGLISRADSAEGPEAAEALSDHVRTLLNQLSRAGGGTAIDSDTNTGRYWLRVRKLKRFLIPELILHWVNAVPFVILMLTGTGMLASRFIHVEARTFTVWFALHKACALTWVVGMPLVVLAWAKLHWRQHIRPVLTWRLDDLLWLVQSSRSLYNRKARVPEADRFNAGQKINACLVMLYFAGFATTGACMLWKPSVLFPWYVHTALFFAALGSVGGHLYLALVNPSTRIALAGIFHGWAPAEYIEHHHPLSLPSAFRPPDEPSGGASLKAVLIEARIEIIILASIALLTFIGLAAFGRGRMAVLERSFTRSFVAAVTPAELSTRHRIGETAKSCDKCHSLKGEIPDIKCEQCHAIVRDRRRTQTGYHGTLKGVCISCHKEHLGPDRSIVPLDPKRFDHTLADFKREGKHAALECEECHRKKRTTGTPGSYYIGLPYRYCTDCHRDPHNGQFIRPCEGCHTAFGWKAKALTFSHMTHSTFRLDGKHASVDCAKCHKPKWPWQPASAALYKGLPTDCAGCHDDPHRKQFKAACDTCHTVSGWKGKALTFSHETNSTFRLEGKHASVDCVKCHKPNRPWQPLASATFKGLSPECVACHEDPHRKQFKAACVTCHTAAGWKRDTLKFDHNRDSKFPLTAKHATTECAKCHPASVQGDPLGRAAFVGLKTECADCHKDPHRGQFERACTKCHPDSATWKVDPQLFDHTHQTRYPLLGKHAATDCAKCHKPQAPETTLGSAPFKGLDTTCEGCHKVKHPDAYGPACVTCHNLEGWPPKMKEFEHLARLRLIGKHFTAKCSACHNDKRMRPVGKRGETVYTCNDCHQADDPHKGTLGDNCTRCHTMMGWKGEELLFDHNTMTQYPLDKDHRNVACAKCHEKGRWKPLSTTCEACHPKFIRKPAAVPARNSAPPAGTTGPLPAP